MRSLADRLRHTLMFELIALFLVVVVGSHLIGESPEKVGALSLMFSVLAMSWNFVFNWMFDLWDRKYRNCAPRGVMLRCVHAVLFEGAIFICGIFLVSWWLDKTLIEAFWLDVGMSAFFLCYAFVYNWTYDLVFPIRPPLAQEG